MKPIIPALALAAVLSACTFSLGTVQPKPDSTKSQMALDIAICQDFAFKQASAPDKQVNAFLLGLTVVGVPVAHEMDKAFQRDRFARCMGSFGYVVTPAAPRRLDAQTNPACVHNSCELLRTDTNARSQS